MKGAVAGENTVCQLCDQWNAGLRYLQQNILAHVPEYAMIPDLGVFARSYDEARMKRIRDEYKQQCAQVNNQSMTLIQRKKRMNIAKYRAIARASQAILDRKFQTGSEDDVYEIHIRMLDQESGQIYKINFPV